MTFYRTLCTALTVLLPCIWAASASAGLPDKKTDRAGWIKASMTGTQAKFCGPLPPKKLRGGSDPDFVYKAIVKKWDGAKMEKKGLGDGMTVANALCKFPGNPDVQKALTPLWQKWTAYYGLNEGDYPDFAAVANPKHPRLPQRRAPKDTRFADVDPVTQADIAKELAVTSYGMDFMSYAHMLDSALKPSEHLKAAFVRKCISGYKSSIARWAICKQDALSLDRKAFFAELTAAKLNPSKRLEAKMKFVQLQNTVKTVAAKHDADAKKDDGVKKVIETLPAEALAKWKTESAPHADLLKWTYKLVDDARAKNKKLMNGCEDQLRKHLTTYLKAKNPRTPEEMKYAFRDNIGSQLANAAALCFVRKRAAQVHWLRASSGAPEYWGIRTMIWHTIAASKVEFDTNRGNDPVGLPKPVVLYANMSTAWSSGPIAKLKESGDTVEITFKKKTWKERVCKAWRETRRVDGIDLKTGKLKYRSVCTKYGTEKRTSQATAVTVAKADAAGLKKGLPASFVRDKDGKGYPVAIYASKKRKKIAGAFGIFW